MRRFMTSSAAGLATLIGTGDYGMAIPPAEAPRVSKSEDTKVKELMHAMYDINELWKNNLLDIENMAPVPQLGKVTEQVVTDVKERDKICDMFFWVDKNKIDKVTISGNEKKTYLFEDKEGVIFAKGVSIELQETEKDNPRAIVKDGKKITFLTIDEPYKQQVRFLAREGDKTNSVAITYYPEGKALKTGKFELPCFESTHFAQRGAARDENLPVQSRVLIEELAKKLPKEKGEMGR